MQQFGAPFVRGQIIILDEIVVDEENTPSVAVALLEGAVGILYEYENAAVVGQELKWDLGVHPFVSAAAVG